MSSKSDPENRIMDPDRWAGKVSNHTQIGGIETAVLDDGGGRGTRIAWVNTGSGLRFRVVLDRCMDIADAFYGPYSLAWISHSGITPPNPVSVDGIKWLDSFGGGLLTTCGLTHVGGPEEDEYGSRGLHGRISHIPVSLQSIQQPNPQTGDLQMSISGRMVQSTVFGAHLELERTISATLGEPELQIQDRVTNLGNEVAPHMLLYHVNFGWPLIDEGAAITWKGNWEARDEESSIIFNDENNFRQCQPPMDEHNGAGEAVAFLDLETDAGGKIHCGVINKEIGVDLELIFPKSQLPWVSNWQHWGRDEYVMALEPGTHPPVGQAAARENGSLIQLDPGETRTYDLTVRIKDI